jgi:NTP pyrophosphatase (non-canonical NTP hydrolase)
MTFPSDALMRRLTSFRADRDWEQFHTVRNLSVALAVEASELLEHFTWAREDQCNRVVEDNRAAIEQEIADVGIVLAYLCRDLNIDLEAAMATKLKLNEQKYPIEKARGRSEKYDRL